MTPSRPDWHAAVGANPYRYWSPQELVAVANAHPPLFPPGEGLSYSNTGYPDRPGAGEGDRSSAGKRHVSRT
jgi:hypothetical protein